MIIKLTSNPDGSATVAMPDDQHRHFESVEAAKDKLTAELNQSVKSITFKVAAAK